MHKGKRNNVKGRTPGQEAAISAKACNPSRDISDKVTSCTSWIESGRDIVESTSQRLSKPHPLKLRTSPSSDFQ